MFDTRIAYVAETGPADARVKRIAVMDSDGYNHSYVTPGGTIVLTPRLSPKGGRLAYVSFQGGVPQVRVADLGSDEQRPLLAGNAMTFAPRYSPDGSQIVFSMMLGAQQRHLCRRRRRRHAAAADDLARDRHRRQLLARRKQDRVRKRPLRNAAALCDERRRSNERRITFSSGCYGAPEWSPDGKLIAFTWRFGDTRRIGVIAPDGTGEQDLTAGPADEGPSWADSSRELVFQRMEANGRPAIYQISLDGSAPRKMTNSPGRIRPQLVGNDGLARCAKSSSCSRSCVAARRFGPACRA